VVSAVLFPFIPLLAKESKRLVPTTPEEGRLELHQFIDESQLRFPHIALAEATKELHRIGEVTAEMIVLSRRAVIGNDSEAAEQVMELEDELIDPLCAVLDNYLNELLDEEVTEDQKWHSPRLKRRISDMERVADLAVDLAQAAQVELPPSQILGKKPLEELSELFKRSHRTYLMAIQAVRDGDREMAQLASRQDDKMDRTYWKARKALTKRRKSGEIDSEQHAIYFDLLRNLERISDHPDNLGISVMRA
jgi:Na+/phosphate symporter